MQGARSSERTDLQGGRGSPAPGVEGHGELTPNCGCGIGALCGAAAVRAPLGGTGGRGKDSIPRIRHGMVPQEGGGGSARGELGTWAAHLGHRRWAWHTLRPLRGAWGSLARPDASPAVSGSKNGSGRNPRHFRLNLKCSLTGRGQWLGQNLAPRGDSLRKHENGHRAMTIFRNTPPRPSKQRGPPPLKLIITHGFRRHVWQGR